MTVNVTLIQACNMNPFADKMKKFVFLLFLAAALIVSAVASSVHRQKRFRGESGLQTVFLQMNPDQRKKIAAKAKMTKGFQGKGGGSDSRTK